MKQKFLALTFLSICFFVPTLVWAECGTIGYFDRFSLEGVNTVTLFLGSQPVARFDVQTCSIQSDSRIQLIKSYVCDGDEIMVDGSNCTIMELKPLGP